MLEIAKAYLVKYLPEGLQDCRLKEIEDIYVPSSSKHPKLRIRKSYDDIEVLLQKYSYNKLNIAC